ncbi:MAG: hypothetical protein GVY14_11625 [Spirochaetes bacterium]|jgi:hypothetical protein|nr:hypothetical protein [Spirochaetota bacterium]
MSIPYVIFVDLDGVLADFDRAVEEITGLPPSQQTPRAMWPRLAGTRDFYANIPWMPDGPELWDRVEPLNPVVLTGLPRGNWAKPQKLEWCRRELGPEVPVIACMSREKSEKAREWLDTHPAEAGPGGEQSPGGARRVPLLIDDRASTREPWEAAGGVFIHHTSAEGSIRSLEELGL